MLMAYDQHWGSSPISGSVAQLTWVEKSLINVLKQVPNEKLVLGLPFYTRLWKEVYSEIDNKTIVTSKAISMEAAEQIIKENMAAKIWDEISGQYYSSYVKDGATYKIWLEDEQSIKLKTELVHKYDLAGVSSWRWGYERPEIWKVINDTLN
jgi:spore germination protein YaaH